ncbi:MAG: tRNA (N(6)-L-threonylcarbamoyladenosine(37)-C(2))-methylthiotransferase MtaB [Clostridia bacterium]|nr:tRNA (N(6)-L-threonylcarbamoyladenosine(37)-C(2))-methylthiotransferase MtaB [Clostridia bacterium]
MGNINKKGKVAFITLGCKVNQYETNAMIQKISNDYEIVSSSEKADVYIVNTCTVTNMSDRKSRQILRRCKELNKNAYIIAVGCYAEVSKEEIEKIKEVDLVLGNKQKNDIDVYLQNLIENNKNTENKNEMQNKYIEFGTVTYTEKTRAVIKIQDGCNNFCSYCIIPYARGRVVSRNSENIINEIQEIAKIGIKEVVITGIHIASYGKDFDSNYKLIDLLEEIDKISGIERIRLGSLEPTIITDEFCKRLEKLSKVCHHFHLSLQSGCDKTLKEMNRHYTSDEFIKVTERLRNLYKDVILTTDIIVGFPNETDEDFEITYNFLKEINFYKMHIFKYSPRKGTVAAKMKNQVSGEVKDIRSHRLLKLSENNEKKYLESYLGKNLYVLFEEKEGNYIKGHTQNYIMVKSKLDEEKINKIVEVKVISSEGDCLIAE